MKHRNLALAAALALAACDHSGDAAKDPSAKAGSVKSPTHATTSPRTTKTAASPAAKKTATTTAPPPAATAEPAPTTPAPYVTTSAAVLQAADSSAVREHESEAPTALSQGNSVPELKITAAIRRAVMFDPSLGFGARNVQIITTGTKVTLRGVVSSENQRGAIEAHARGLSGVNAVDNLITVKN